MNTRKVWLVTGASKGLGLSLVKQLLDKNYRVAATSRTAEALKAKISEESESFLPLEMDLTDDENVKQAIDKVVNHFGSIDVVVNNAGFGLTGTIEELSDSEVKDNFEVNVFGALNVIRNAAPYLRKQQSGHIFNISSVGGYTGNFPGFGIYCATKFAMAGFTESLAVEMKDFGVNTTVVYPGYFRTDFLTKDSIKTPESPIAAYSAARNLEAMHFDEIDGNQLNDPEKAAEVMIELSEMEQPPVHFFMGADAYQYANLKIENIQKDMAALEKLGTSTAFSK